MNLGKKSMHEFLPQIKAFYMFLPLSEVRLCFRNTLTPFLKAFRWIIIPSLRLLRVSLNLSWLSKSKLFFLPMKCVWINWPNRHYLIRLPLTICKHTANHQRLALMAIPCQTKQIQKFSLLSMVDLAMVMVVLATVEVAVAVVVVVVSLTSSVRCV